MYGYSLAQEAAVHWLPAATAVISFCCSFALVVHICYHPKRKTYHRLVLGLSICDMMACLIMITARFLDLEEPSRTCSNVAALQVMTVGTAVLYNGCLAVLFLLLVRFGTRERTLVKYFEIPSHVGCILGSSIVAVLAYFLEALNPVSVSSECWLSAYPRACDGDECTRGKKWGIFFEQFSHGVFYCLLVVIAVSNSLIYYKVHKTIGRNRQYSLDSNEPGRRRYSLESFQHESPRRHVSLDSNADARRRLSLDSRDTTSRDSCDDPSHRPPRRRLSLEPGKSLRRRTSISSFGEGTAANKLRQVAMRSFLFCGGFAITYFFGIIVVETERRIENSQGTWWFYMFLVLDGIFWPLQGFWDSIIYFRPRYIQWRAACPVNSRFFAFRKTVFTMGKPGATSRAQQRLASRVPIARLPKNHDKDDDDELSFAQEMQRCEALASISVPLGGSFSHGFVG